MSSPLNQVILSLGEGGTSLWGTTLRSGGHTVVSSTAPCCDAASSLCTAWSRGRLCIWERYRKTKQQFKRNPQSGVFSVSPHHLIKNLFIAQVLLDYHMKPVDLSEDFTVAASNVITTLAFGKEVRSLFFLTVYFELGMFMKLTWKEQLWFCQTCNWLFVCFSVGEVGKVSV